MMVRINVECDADTQEDEALVRRLTDFVSAEILSGRQCTIDVGTAKTLSHVVQPVTQKDFYTGSEISDWFDAMGEARKLPWPER